MFDALDRTKSQGEVEQRLVKEAFADDDRFATNFRGVQRATFVRDSIRCWVNPVS